MKIAEYIGAFGTGGIEHVVLQLFKNMNSQELKIDFLIDFKQDVECSKEIAEKNGRILSVFNSDGKITSYRQKILKTVYFYKLLRREKYDIIHFHISYPSTLLYCFVARVAGVKVRLVQVHAASYGNTGRLHRWLSEISKIIFLSSATGLLAVSQDAGRWMFGKKKFEVLTNGIEVDRFGYSLQEQERLRRQYGIAEDAVVIGHVGRFADAKNHSFLLKIFRDILKKEPKAVLLLAGEGSLKERIRSEAIKEGIAQHVLWMPFAQAVQNYYQVMDAFVFPSAHEGFGIAVLEAQTAGLLVWISDKVPREVIVTDNVYTFSLERQPEEWAEDILKKLNNYQRKAQNQAARDAGFDISEKGKWLEDYYRKEYQKRRKD